MPAGEGVDGASQGGSEKGRRRPVQQNQKSGPAHGGRAGLFEILQSPRDLGEVGEKGWTSLHGLSVGCARPRSLIWINDGVT